jgi:hypothetical protein
MPRAKAHTRRPPPSDLDTLLFEILSGIAEILVSSGHGFSRISELTKTAFVRAAFTIDPRGEHKKISIARIAALTGLTRLDVSKIVRCDEHKSSTNRKPTNRVARVAQGWSTDKRFIRPNKSPRQLPFAGPGNTFAVLVRKYSGDIPPKAMLSEMARLGMLQQDEHGQLTLLRSNIAQSPRTTKALRAVVPWIRFLANSSSDRLDQQLDSRSESLELKFESMPQVFAALRTLQDRHKIFVRGLEQLGTAKNLRGRYSIKVSVAIAATSPRATKRKAQDSHREKQ